jgi:hypothetical protein
VIRVDCKQNTPEWLQARLGLPTASCFDQIVTPKGKPSTSQERYLAKLVAEWFMGEQIDDHKSGFMERGHDLEPKIVAAYEFENDIDTEEVGLCLLDDRTAGASPDRLVGTEGILEIKAPSAVVQMMYVLDGPPNDYFVQVQGQLWVCQRAWVDLRCGHPTLPHVQRRYERDAEFIGILSQEVPKFAARLAKAKDSLRERKEAYDRSRRERLELVEDVPAELS